jgi:DNA-binding NtrC family response regulator
MKKYKIRICLFEDDEDVAGSIAFALRKSDEFNFELTVVSHVQPQAAQDFAQGRYDVAIVDLRLDSEPWDHRTLHLGHSLISSCHDEDPDALIIVYSAYAGPRQVVNAMRSGATDFFAKNETTADQLVTEIEAALVHRREERRRLRRVEARIEEGEVDWGERYNNCHIVVVDDKVVAAGKTRLEALMSYRSMCLQDPALPLDPPVVCVQQAAGVAVPARFQVDLH